MEVEVYRTDCPRLQNLSFQDGLLFGAEAEFQGHLHRMPTRHQNVFLQQALESLTGNDEEAELSGVQPSLQRAPLEDAMPGLAGFCAGPAV